MKLIYLYFIFLITRTDATEMYLGRSSGDIIKLYSGSEVIVYSQQELGFRVNIASMRCNLVYRLRNGIADSLSCDFECGGRMFSGMLDDFARITEVLLAEGRLDSVELRLHGVVLAKTPVRDWDPLNFIRLKGRWKPGYVFSAAIEGSEREAEGARSKVTSLGFTILPEQDSTKAPL